MSKNSGQLTHLSTGTTLEGTLTVDNDVRIAGTIKGSVITTGQLIIEATGVVDAELKVVSATIAGKVTGNIEATDKIVLESKAELTGNIRTRQLVIEDGAYFQGNCAMGSNGKTNS